MHLPATTIGDLPLDIFLDILSHISDHKTLRAASFVSKPWSHLFQNKLFRTSVITIQPGTNASTVFLSAIVQPCHSRLLPHITSVRIQAPPPNLDVPIVDLFCGNVLRRGQVVSPVFSSELESFLLATPSLAHLTFWDVKLDWDSLERDQWNMLRHIFAKLREITIYSRSAKFPIPLSLLLHAGQLETLRISDMSVVYNQEMRRFPGFLRKPPRFQTPLIQTLSLKDISLVARFSYFAQCYHWDFFSNLRDLTIGFMDHSDSPHGVPSLIVSSFLGRFGMNVQTLRLHVTKFGTCVGSSMNTEDLESLGNLQHLEVILHADDNRTTNIRMFPETWLLPMLTSLPSKKFISRLNITYQLFIPAPFPSLFGDYSLSLWPLLQLLDKEFTEWLGLKELAFYVDLYQKDIDILEHTRSEYRVDAPFGETPIAAPFPFFQKKKGTKAIAMFSDPRVRHYKKSNNQRLKTRSSSIVTGPPCNRLYSEAEF